MAAEFQHRKILESSAKAAGHDLAQVALGLRRFIADVQANPSLLPAGVMTGVDWLKSPSCGGLATNPQDGYVPCQLGKYGAWSTLFETDYRTTFALNPTTNFIEARTTFIPTIPSDPDRRGTIADQIVNTAMEENPVPANGMFTNFMSNVAVNANDLSGRPAIMGNPNSADFGRVLLVASNAPSQDLWLRVDGTNQMLAALNMGGNDLVNAKGIQATGNLNLGGGASIGGDARIQGNLQVDKDASVKQDLFVTRDAAVGRDLAVEQNITSRNGDIQAVNGNVTASNGVRGDARGVVVADDVYATDMTLSNGLAPRMSQAVFDMRIVGPSAQVRKPSCPTAGTERIFTTIQDIASDQGNEIAGARIRVSNNGTSWTVNPEVLEVITTYSTNTDPVTGAVTSISVNKSRQWKSASSAKIAVATKCN
jgi:hypothetical protein